jgi:pimeloyl-ACP methyl ester carboxylesterase
MVKFQDKNIYFDEKGNGFPVVLLHGYLESSEIWDGFAESLAKKFRVIAIDLPGHGKSDLITPVQTMELLADAVNETLKHLEISQTFIVGHSLGGYVALAYLEKYRNKVSGICLFHSHPMADNSERKRTRDLEIQILKQGKKDLLLQVGDLGGMAPKKAENMPAEVERIHRIACNCSANGMIAMLEGMKLRPDRQYLLKECSTPILFILGKQDKYLSWELMEAIAHRSPKGEALLLPDAGHMGFIEEKDLCLNVLSSFIEQHI